MRGRGHGQARPGFRSGPVTAGPVTAGAVLGGAVLAVAALGGCGTVVRGSSLDPEVADRLAAAYGAGRPAVRCPPSVADTAGRRFVCVATWGGVHLLVHGTVLAGGRRVSVRTSAAAVDRAGLAARIGRDLSRRTANAAAVTCGSGVVVVPAGRTVACVAVEDGIARSLTVSVAPSGAVRYALGRPGRPAT